MESLVGLPVPEASLPEAGLRYVARQPILDRRGRATGYELLYRDGLWSAFRGDGEQATRTMLDNLLLFDLKRLTGGLAAFINCTEETLTSGLAEMSAPETTVLELLETIEPTPKLVKSCRALKSQGYQLALDDFEWRPGMEPLVEMAMIAVGETRFRKLAVAAIAVGLCPTHAREALRMALVRARFCELSAADAGYNSTEQYLIGLFSLLPAMMQVEMENALANICLRKEIRDVLLGKTSEEGWLLRWIESQERGDWDVCDRIAVRRALNLGTLLQHLMEAVHWSDGMLHPVQ